MPRSDAHLSIRIDLANAPFQFGQGGAAAGDWRDRFDLCRRAVARHVHARAWKLPEDMNSVLQERLVKTFAGGSLRGGATLTPTGENVLKIYESIREEAERAVAKRLTAMDAMRA